MEVVDDVLRRSMLLAEGYRLGTLENKGRALALASDRLLLINPGTQKHHVLWHEGSHGEIAYDSLSGAIYFINRYGAIWRKKVDGAAATLFAEPPLLAGDYDDAAIGFLRNHETRYPIGLRIPRYTWCLQISRDASAIVTIRKAPPSRYHVVVLERTGGVSTLFEVVYPAGLGVCFEKSWIAHPGSGRSAPRIFDLTGRELFDFSEAISCEISKETNWYEAAISPIDNSVALASGPLGPLIVWRPLVGEVNLIDSQGVLPSWSPDGRWLWYRKGSREVWRFDMKTQRSEVFLRIGGRDCYETHGSATVWGHPARFSRRGNYVLLDISSGDTSAACIADMKAKTVQVMEPWTRGPATWLI